MGGAWERVRGGVRTQGGGRGARAARRARDDRLVHYYTTHYYTTHYYTTHYYNVV